MSDSANGISAISSQYRFAGMPFGDRADKVGQQGVMFYSYEDGPMHSIALASFPTKYGFDASSPMTQWLEADLAAVDRAKTPWIVVNVHAPWYNSNTQHTKDGNKMQAAYEALFIQYKVNIVYSGHVRARGAWARGSGANRGQRQPLSRAREHAARPACVARPAALARRAAASTARPPPCLARSPRRCTRTSAAAL